MSVQGCTRDCYDYAAALHANLSGRSLAALVPSYANPTEPIVIHLLFAIVKILALGNNGVLQLFGNLLNGWVDPRLRWNPKDHKGLTACPVDKASVWTPVYTLLNPASTPLEYAVSSAGVRVGANGYIVATMIAEFVTACDMQLVHFPFDQQTCTVDFTSFHIGPQLWRPSPVIATASLDFYSNSSTDPWRLVSTEFRTGNKSFEFNKSILHFPTFSIVITLARSPLYYVANLILPSALLMILVGFVFVMPPGSEMKVELSATLALALYVLQQIISSMLPTSDRVPYCQVALNAGLLLSGVSLVTSIVSLTLRSARIRLPKSVLKWYIEKLGSVCFLRKYRHVLEHDAHAEQKMSNGNDIDSGHRLLEAKESRASGGGDELADIRQLLHDLLELKRRKHLKNERTNMHKAVWSRIDICMNLTVLLFYIIAVIYTTAVYLVPRKYT